MNPLLESFLIFFNISRKSDRVSIFSSKATCDATIFGKFFWIARIVNEQSEIPRPVFSLWLWYIHEMCFQLNCWNRPWNALPACSGLPINRVNVVNPYFHFGINTCIYFYYPLCSRVGCKFYCFFYINQRFFHSKCFGKSSRTNDWRFPYSSEAHNLSQRIWLNRPENGVCNKIRLQSSFSIVINNKNKKTKRNNKQIKTLRLSSVEIKCSNGSMDWWWFCITIINANRILFEKTARLLQLFDGQLNCRQCFRIRTTNFNGLFR